MLLTAYGLFDVPAFSQTEAITISTYYPSPVGVYRELRAQRQAIGDTYVDASQNCWGAGCATTINANADLVVEGNVGIGTVAPRSNLDVNGGIRLAQDVCSDMNFPGQSETKPTCMSTFKLECITGYYRGINKVHNFKPWGAIVSPHSNAITARAGSSTLSGTLYNFDDVFTTDDVYETKESSDGWAPIIRCRAENGWIATGCGANSWQDGGNEDEYILHNGCKGQQYYDNRVSIRCCRIVNTDTGSFTFTGDKYTGTAGQNVVY